MKKKATTYSNKLPKKPFNVGSDIIYKIVKRTVKNNSKQK